MIEDSEQKYTVLINTEVTMKTFLTSANINKLYEEQQKNKLEGSARSKINNLWLSYQSMLKVARSLLKAGRTGSWLMHLYSVSKCLPIFAAAGH